MDEILRSPIEAPSAWLAEDYGRDASWMDILTPDEIADLDQALARLDAAGLQWPDFGKDEFDIPLLGRRLQRILAEIRSGRGFALIRGIPVRRYGPTQLRNLYWGIGSHLGEVISQNAKGHLIGEVKDSGANYADPNVRGYTTRAFLRPHSDSADVVGLFCLRKAHSGGTTTISSSMAIYNTLLREHPEYLQVLYDGFQYDLRGEGATGKTEEVSNNRLPVFSYHEGRLSCRFNPKAIETAPIKTGAQLSEQQLAAVHYIEALALDPRYRLDMLLEPGDIQLIDNYSVLHSRDDFIDHDDPDERRLLLRMWINIFDGRQLAPRFANRYNTGTRRGIAALRANQEPKPGSPNPPTKRMPPHTKTAQ